MRGHLSLDGAGRTDRGRIRERNEDAVLVRTGVGLLAVADGMGGAPGGDMASRLALDALESVPAGGMSAGGMARAIEGARRRIEEVSFGDPSLRGLGTTITALHVDPGSGAYVLGHVGDSRAYVLDAAGLRRLSRDHTWVQDRLDDGRLTPEEARGHPMGHLLTRVLGDDGPVDADIRTGSLAEGSRILLCTDGLTACVTEEEIEAVLGGVDSGRVEEAAADLVDRTLSRGAPDNVSVVVAFLRRIA